MKKKKIGIVLSVVLALSLMLVPLTGCGLVHGFFGLFSTGNGNRLTSFVPSDANALTTEAARTAVEGFRVTPASNSSGGESLPETQSYHHFAPFLSGGTQEGRTFTFGQEYQNAIRDIYGGVHINTRWWLADRRGNLQIEEDQTLEVYLTDFTMLLRDNVIAIAGNVRIPHLVLLPEVIDWAEELNRYHRFYDGIVGDANVRSSWRYRPPGFDRIIEFFNVTVNGQPHVVMQTNAFTEISSHAVGGGGTAQFIRQNQALYNAQGRLVRFQSSTGIRTHMGRGTENVGHNFEVFFNWQAHDDGLDLFS